VISKKKDEKKKEMKNGSDIGAVFVSCAHNFQAEDSLPRPRPFLSQWGFAGSYITVDLRKQTHRI